MKQTPEEIKYRLSDLGVQIGNIALEYITELEKEIGELKYQFHNLAEMDYSHQDRIEELTAQLEKMKCCENCLYNNEYGECDLGCYEECKNFDKWELANG